MRFHDLRHTAATLAIKQGIPLPTVSKMLGHSGPAMTLRRYAHLLDEMRNACGADYGRAVLTPLALDPTPYPDLQLSATTRDRKVRDFPGFIGFAGQ